MVKLSTIQCLLISQVEKIAAVASALTGLAVWFAKSGFQRPTDGSAYGVIFMFYLLLTLGVGSVWRNVLGVFIFLALSIILPMGVEDFGSANSSLLYSAIPSGVALAVWVCKISVLHFDELVSRRWKNAHSNVTFLEHKTLFAIDRTCVAFMSVCHFFLVVTYVVSMK